MKKLLLLAFLLLSCFAGGNAANAACSGTTNGQAGSLSTLTATDFANGRPAGSITPDCIRDLAQSTYPNVIDLSNWCTPTCLPTGGDDTTAINAAIASVLPASFTGTASIVPSVTLTTTAGLTSGSTIPFTSTTGVTVGQLVMSGNGYTVAAGTTVASFVANTSVTLSTPILTAVPAGAQVVFGALLSVTGSPGGTIAAGQTVSDGGVHVLPGTVIQSISSGTGHGTGGSGIYNLTPLLTAAVSSETMTFQSPATAQIYAPAGTYKHSGDIILNSACMYGDGPATVFQSTNVNSPTNPTNSIILSGTAPCLRNMSVNSLWTGTRQGNNDSSGVDIGSLTVPATAYLVEGVRVNGAASAGIFNFGSNTGIIRNNFVYNTLADGIIHGGDSSYAAFSNLEEGNYVYNPGDDCFSIDAYTGTQIYDIRILHNYCENGQSRGINVNGGTGHIISENMIVNPAATGFQIGANSGISATSNIIMSHNQCINCSGTGAWVIGQSGSLTTNILIDGNDFYNVNLDCFYVGGGSNYETGVTIINNQCVGPATVGSSGSGIWLQGVTNVTVKNNLIRNFQQSGIQSATPFNLGYADIEGNTCDKVGISSGTCIYMPTETLTAMIIRNNMLYSDGTSAGGFIVVSGVANLMIDGNFGDVNTNTITGMTAGNYVNPYGQGQVNGTATVTCTTGSPTSSFASIRGVQTHC